MGEFYINYILICVVCYLIGSVPFAYLVVKKLHSKDVRNEGSGNVGAMNSYDVTGSFKTGVLVLILDFLKGMVPLLILMFVYKMPLSLVILPAILLVAGHNYPVFLKFKGGRGIATGAAIAFAINFMLPLIWGLIFFIAFRVKSNVHIASVVATILFIFPVIFFHSVIDKFTYNPGNEPGEYFLLFTFCASLSLLVLLKHIEPVYELVMKYKSKNKNVTQE